MRLPLPVIDWLVGLIRRQLAGCGEGTAWLLSELRRQLIEESERSKP